MADRIDVDVSGAITRGLALRQLATNLQTKVVNRAIATLKRRLGPEVNRQLSAVLNLSKSEINKRVTVTSGDGFVEVTASGKRIPLGKFGAQYGGHKTAGATAQVFIGGQTKVYSSAFILSRKGAVLARQRISGNKRAGRYPLQALFGPDLGSVLVSHSAHGIITNLSDFALTTLSDEVDRLIAVELETL